MNYSYTIPTDDEVRQIESKLERSDWSSLYNALAEHGKIIVPELPVKTRNALYNRYRDSKRKVKLTRIDDSGSYLIRLVARQ